MKRGLWLVSFALLAGVTACGPDEVDRKADAGPDDTTSPAEWGFVDKTCLHYSVADAPTSSYMIEVSFGEKVGGVEAWKLLHRHNGFQQRTDWYELSGNELLLLRRDVAGQMTAGNMSTYDPPPVLLRTNLKTGDSIETVTQTRVAGDTTLEEAQTFRTASLGDEPVDGPEGEVTAQKLTLAIESDSLGDVVDRAWFAPQVGFVKFDPAGELVGDVTLKSVEVLEGDAKCVAQ